MGTTRPVLVVQKSVNVTEGAGVHLKRAFGNNDVPKLDPFLLFDDFHTSDREKYQKGFPWHPHRGIETISYVIHGQVEHGDSLGNSGTISTGCVQWMTAGSGIIHQEMPDGDKEGLLWGIQLWANLPKSHKMMQPRYQDLKADQIPEVIHDNGTRIKVICGQVGSTIGPVKDIVIDPMYLDVLIPANTTFTHNIAKGHKVFAYVLEGQACFSPGDGMTGNEHLVLFGDGDHVDITTGNKNARFLLVAGRPINEPVAWHGPIVMNTDEELETAFKEYLNGTFIKTEDP